MGPCEMPTQWGVAAVERGGGFPVPDLWGFQNDPSPPGSWGYRKMHWTCHLPQWSTSEGRFKLDGCLSNNSSQRITMMAANDSGKEHWWRLAFWDSRYIIKPWVTPAWEQSGQQNRPFRSISYVWVLSVCGIGGWGNSTCHKWCLHICILEKIVRLNVYTWFLTHEKRYTEQSSWIKTETVWRQ